MGVGVWILSIENVIVISSKLVEYIIHAIATIYDHRNSIEVFVDPTFYKDTYLKAYSSMVYPIPDFRQLP